MESSVKNVKTYLAVCEAGSSKTPSRLLQVRSEEHTSELQSLRHLVCRLLLEKKKKLRVRDLEDRCHALRLGRRHRQLPGCGSHAGSRPMKHVSYSTRIHPGSL